MVSNYSIYNTFGYEFNNHIIFRSTYDNQSDWGEVQTGGNEIMASAIKAPREMSFMLESLFGIEDKKDQRNRNNLIKGFIKIRNTQYEQIETTLKELRSDEGKNKAKAHVEQWKHLFTKYLFTQQENDIKFTKTEWTEDLNPIQLL
mgnify:CR=1 FL=1